MGRMDAPCVQPCTQTSVQAEFQYSDKLAKNDPTIYLAFDPHVEVTTHALPTFQPLEVLQVRQVKQ